MIVVGVLTDGRDDLLAQTLASARENLSGFDHLYVVHDDYNRKGLAGAVQTVWDHAVGVGADYLFHLEDDWTFTAPVDLTVLAAWLDDHPDYAQLVLQRQALTSDEHHAGGVAAHAHWVEHDGWVEQSDIFSLNPCLIPRTVLFLGWPSGPLGVGNESGMTSRCRDAGYRFAFRGQKVCPPAVTHIGSYRASGWSL